LKNGNEDFAKEKQQTHLQEKEKHAPKLNDVPVDSQLA
jgi:hypothetical protein